MRSAALAATLAAGSVFAHGLPPQATSVAPSPWSDGGVLASTTFGLLVTSDQCTWRWLCPDHLGLGAREVPAWFTTPSGALFAASFTGLLRSGDRGCSFERVAFFDPTGAADLAVDGQTIFVTTSKFGVTNGLARSIDDGRSFEWTSLRANDVFFSAVRLAPSRPARVYVSAWYFTPKLARLSKSDDRGVTFTSVELPPSVAPGNPFFVHAVDPVDPDVLFASSTDDSAAPERTIVLRSDDGGQTFTRVLEADGRVKGMLRSAGRWWVAVGDRVFTSAEGRVFEAVAASPQRACVGQGAGEVLVCGRSVADGYSLAAFDAGVAEPRLKWQQIAGPIDCPPQSPAAVACGAAWPVERAELGLQSDHVATCGAAPPIAEARPCGCQQVEVGLVAAAVVFFRRRTSRVESGRYR
ncbi:MAG: hypothetical protein JNJ54_18365 [Myxococcaceae bacterium]|nr:hypothetical protein [Myxococcaceae bacterium]